MQGGLFSDGELASFDQQGFVIVRGLTSPALIARMREVTNRGVKEATPPVEYEADLNYPGAPESREAIGGGTIRRLKQALTRDYVFLEWMLQPAVLGRLKQLLGPRVVCPLAHHNCVMTKHPQFGSETGWHQDIRYWSFQRPQLVNAWIALGSETRENGCLQVIPGSHRMAFRPEQFDEMTFFRNDLAENQPIIATKEYATLQAGDVLFFHCLTLHAASRNSGAETKCSAVFTFRPEDNLPLAGSRSASLAELLLTPGA